MDLDCLIRCILRVKFVNTQFFFALSMIPFFSEVLEVASVLSSFDDECSFEIELQAIKVEIVNSEIPKPKTLPVFS